jgi:hypothetical protein
VSEQKQKSDDTKKKKKKKGKQHGKATTTTTATNHHHILHIPVQSVDQVCQLEPTYWRRFHIAGIRECICLSESSREFKRVQERESSREREAKKM